MPNKRWANPAPVCQAELHTQTDSANSAVLKARSSEPRWRGTNRSGASSVPSPSLIVYPPNLDTKLHSKCCQWKTQFEQFAAHLKFVTDCSAKLCRGGVQELPNAVKCGAVSLTGGVLTLCRSKSVYSSDWWTIQGHFTQWKYVHVSHDINCLCDGHDDAVTHICIKLLRDIIEVGFSEFRLLRVFSIVYLLILSTWTSTGLVCISLNMQLTATGLVMVVMKSPYRVLVIGECTRTRCGNCLST